MSKYTKKMINAFSRIQADAKNPALQGAFPDEYGSLCACDAYMIARIYGGAALPEFAEVPRVSSDPMHARLLSTFCEFDWENYHLSATSTRADDHGEKPVLSSEYLRRFSRFSRHEHGNDLFPVGDSFVSAARLARLLDILPDASIYTLPDKPFAPVFLRGAAGDAVLLPCRIAWIESEREKRASEVRATVANWESTQQLTTQTDTTRLPSCCPFPPASILESVQNTAETPVSVIGYKRDGNTVAVHRVRAHHVIDNVYVYASKEDRYGYFAWRFVSLFACGYALDLDCVQDNKHHADHPEAICNVTSFRGMSLADFLRALNASFADESAFVAGIEASMRANAHVKLSYVRMLEAMGNHAELIARVMDYRHQRESAQKQQEEAREKARIEQEKQEEQQRQQEHAQALEDCRAALLSDGERKPVDGAILCELAASLGVSVSLKLKGWIMRKLATVTIEDGHMVMYQYNRQKKTEKGSNAFWPFMQSLMEALHVWEQSQHQEQSETSIPQEEANDADLDHLFGRAYTPKAENQTSNLENPNLQPVASTEQISTQDHKHDCHAPNAPKLENQPPNPASIDRLLPDTWTHEEQLTMQHMLNTS